MSPRVVVHEAMDAPDLPAASHQAALRGLARLNRVSGSIRIIARELDTIRGSRTPLKLLDIASGGGDVPIALWRYLSNRREVKITGYDRSLTAVEHARSAAAKGGAAVEFLQHDVLRDPLPRGFDVVTCSLFLHHLSEGQAVELLEKMGEAAGRAVIVNDLRRGTFNYAAVWAASRLVTRSPIVHADGPASVRAAFTTTELKKMVQAAGLRGATVRRRFPCRMVMRWCKP